jgi:hypothetical protein
MEWNRFESSFKWLQIEFESCNVNLELRSCLGQRKKKKKSQGKRRETRTRIEMQTPRGAATTSQSQAETNDAAVCAPLKLEGGKREQMDVGGSGGRRAMDSGGPMAQTDGGGRAAS